MKTGMISVGALAASLLFSGNAAALDTVPMLSLDIAKRMAASCEAMSAAEGWRMNIAIVDRGANLIVFRRMDNAFLISVDIAIGKARTSARLPFPTRVVAELAYGKDGNPAPLPGIAEVDGVIAFAGGLPIMVGDAHVGGIGVSGGTADQDEVRASTALDAVADDLK